MIKFEVMPGRGVILEYQSEFGGNGWVWQEIKTHKTVRISRSFTFNRTDLLAEPTETELDDINAFGFRFRFASSEPAYYRVPGRILGIDNDVLIAKQGIDWSRKLFVAERNTSVFRRIAQILPKGEEIRIGGEDPLAPGDPRAIPIPVFEEMVTKFPNSLELDHYARARVAAIVGDYLDPTRDFRADYERYLTRRKAREDRTLPLPQRLVETEIEKYALIRDTIREWLALGDARSEAAWQRMIVTFLPLIFPKYVAVLTNVAIEDHYSVPGKVKHRFLDLALVDANGHLDVIEIKRPFDDALLRKARYRDNHVPTADLSGTIMQAEKYLFHLAKWGAAGEEKLTAKYADQLPPGLAIRITSPKAILILGRDQKPAGGTALDGDALFDLEIIKRKYANMMDILTYDDLVRRLERIIASLQRRATTGFNLPDVVDGKDL
jgi:hypothetical protein